MSSLAAAPARTSTLGVARSPTAAVALAWLLYALLTLPKALAVWRTGVFHNPDDAMRAVELRDLMAGQGWFDMVPHRLSPDHPFVMHWSRLVDLPLAAMVRAFEIVLSPADAELAMRLVEPNLLFLLSAATVVGLAGRLIGPSGLLPAAALLGGSVEFVGSFIPGHIHHHGVQVTLLLGAAKLLVDALESESNRSWGSGAAARSIGPRAFASGGCAALSLGIGLQNLPFVVGLAAAVALAWAIGGERQARTLRAFGAGLATVAGGVFLLDVPPGSYLAATCDAFSIAHLAAASAGGAAFVALSLARPRAWPVRVGLAAAVAVAVTGLVALVAPACLSDPMSSVDPVLRTQWLAEVGEALPLAGLIARAPLDGLALLATLCFGLGATIAAAVVSRRTGWLVLGVLAIVGFAATLWQVRVAASACAFMVPGLAWAVVVLFRRIARDPRRPALLVATIVGMVGNGSILTSAAAVLDQHGPAQGTRRIVAPASCFDPEAFAGLAALPPGLVLSTIDPGSAMLAATHHSVLAAPYHRNSYGNRVALLALNATPEAALPLIRDARATYLALCRTSNETIDTATSNPDSLSAALLDGRVPAWATPLPSAGVYLLFRVGESAAR